MLNNFLQRFTQLSTSFINAAIKSSINNQQIFTQKRLLSLTLHCCKMTAPPLFFLISLFFLLPLLLLLHLIRLLLPFSLPSQRSMLLRDSTLGTLRWYSPSLPSPKFHLWWQIIFHLMWKRFMSSTVPLKLMTMTWWSIALYFSLSQLWLSLLSLSPPKAQFYIPPSPSYSIIFSPYLAPILSLTK